MRHKHADEIIAWANGAQIQYYDAIMRRWSDNENPKWYEEIKFRVKPELALMAIKPMNELEKAMLVLVKKAAEATEAHHAMNFAQAALNLANTQQVLSQIK